MHASNVGAHLANHQPSNNYSEGNNYSFSAGRNQNLSHPSRKYSQNSVGYAFHEGTTKPSTATANAKRRT